MKSTLRRVDMTDYRQMQELQEQMEKEALSDLVKIAYSGNEPEAERLAAKLGLHKQLEKEINHAGL